MAQACRPVVYWGQSKENVYVKVDVCEITSGPEVDINEDYVDFRACGTGGRGKNIYEFRIEFYLPIDPKLSKYTVTGRMVEFQFRKVGVDEIWPRLMESPQKPPWLRPDFEHFAFNDSDQSSNEDLDGLTMSQEEMLEKMEKEFKETESNVIHDLKTYYLFLYNLFQWIGYSYIFITILYRYFSFGSEMYADIFATVGPAMMVCQLLAVLEIIHPLLGWVRTSIMMPVVQVGGRALALFGLLAAEPKLQAQEPVMWLFLTWSTIELVRYPYYMLNVIDREIGFVTWVRYTAWIPLYPTGFVLEGIIMLLAVPLFDQSNKWCIDLPNAANVSFHFPTFLRIYMLCFIPGMYVLMQRMYEQRKKKIKPAKSLRNLKAKKTS